MKSITNHIRIIAKQMEWENTKQAYRSALDKLSKECKAYGINRDGDIFQVSCPSCKSKKIAPAGCGFFVCSRKHVFSTYTEDGVAEIKNDTKILGPDYVDGEDAHGHNPYRVYKADEKSPIFFSMWMSYENPDGSYKTSTVQDVSDEVWKLKAKIKPIDSMYMNYYAEINTMVGGKPVAKLGSQIKTWPSYVSNMKWFLILRELDGTDWKLGIIEPGER